MTYEEENRKLEQELNSIESQLEELNKLERNTYHLGTNRWLYESQIRDAKVVLKLRKDTIERILKEGPTSRAVLNTLRKIPEPPKKVYQGSLTTKPIYSVDFRWLLLIFCVCLVIFLIMLAFIY